MRIYSRNGFSLIETVLTMAIVALAITGLLSFFSYGTGFLEKQGLRRQALALVNEQLEAMRARYEPGEAPPAQVIDEEVTIERVVMGKLVSIRAQRTTAIEKMGDDEGSHLTVMVSYDHGNIADSITIQTGFYGW